MLLHGFCQDAAGWAEPRQRGRSSSSCAGVGLAAAGLPRRARAARGPAFACRAAARESSDERSSSRSGQAAAPLMAAWRAAAGAAGGGARTCALASPPPKRAAGGTGRRVSVPVLVVLLTSYPLTPQYCFDITCTDDGSGLALRLLLEAPLVDQHARPRWFGGSVGVIVQRLFCIRSCVCTGLCPVRIYVGSERVSVCSCLLCFHPLVPCPPIVFPPRQF
jgi:hypothetical protein